MYISKADLLRRITKADLDNLTKSDAGGISGDAVLDTSIRDACSLIDGYLNNVVKILPISPVPDAIKRCATDITIFNLHSRIQYSDIPEFWKDKYDAAINFLKDIAKGLAGLETELDDKDVADSITYYAEMKRSFE